MNSAFVTRWPSPVVLCGCSYRKKAWAVNKSRSQIMCKYETDLHTACMPSWGYIGDLAHVWDMVSAWPTANTYYNMAWL